MRANSFPFRFRLITQGQETELPVDVPVTFICAKPVRYMMITRHESRIEGRLLPKEKFTILGRGDIKKILFDGDVTATVTQ